MTKTIFLFILLFSISIGDRIDSTSDESVSKEVSGEDHSNASSVSVEDHSNGNSISKESNELTFGTRIIGGRTARPGELSFVAQLLVYFKLSNRVVTSLCSGTVLSNKHILTAAHCVYSGGRKVSGVNARIVARSGQTFVYFRQNEIFLNPAYKGHFNDDIAILKLTNGFINNYGIAPLLPTANIVRDIFINTASIVAGWGKTSNSGYVSSALQYANVNVISNRQCKSRFGKIVTPTVICTLDRKKGICGGDSGGPLMINREGKTYIIGVNAFGATNCEAFLPSGYTYILQYMDWISSIME